MASYILNTHYTFIKIKNLHLKLKLRLLHLIISAPCLQSSEQVVSQHIATARALSPSGKHRLLHPPFISLHWLTPAARRPFIFTYLLPKQFFYLCIFLYISSSTGSSGQIKRFLLKQRAPRPVKVSGYRLQPVKRYSAKSPTPRHFFSLTCYIQQMKKSEGCIANVELILNNKETEA